jgi:hypothetical protein
MERIIRDDAYLSSDTPAQAVRTGSLHSKKTLYNNIGTLNCAVEFVATIMALPAG